MTATDLFRLSISVFSEAFARTVANRMSDCSRRRNLVGIADLTRTKGRGIQVSVRVRSTHTRQCRRKPMKTLIIGSVAVASVALGTATVFAQSGPQGGAQSSPQGTVQSAPQGSAQSTPQGALQSGPQGGTTITLTPDQSAAIRALIKDRLAEEMRGSGGERVADAAAGVITLTPDQQAAVRSAIRGRIAAEMREGLADRLADRMSDMQAAGPRALTPEQRAAVRSAISERLANDMRGNVGQSLADAAATLSTLTPQQQAAVRTIIRNRVAAEVREGLADQLADRLGD
jgi:hypothetical protein